MTLKRETKIFCKYLVSHMCVPQKSTLTGTQSCSRDIHRIQDYAPGCGFCIFHHKTATKSPPPKKKSLKKKIQQLFLIVYKKNQYRIVIIFPQTNLGGGGVFSLLLSSSLKLVPSLEVSHHPPPPPHHHHHGLPRGVTLMIIGSPERYIVIHSHPGTAGL